MHPYTFAADEALRVANGIRDERVREAARYRLAAEANSDRPSLLGSLRAPLVELGRILAPPSADAGRLTPRLTDYPYRS